MPTKPMSNTKVTTKLDFPYPIEQVGDQSIQVHMELDQELTRAIELATERVCVAAKIPEGMWSDLVSDAIHDVTRRAILFSRVEIH